MAHSYMLFERVITLTARVLHALITLTVRVLHALITVLEFLTSVVGRRRIASFARGGWGGWTIVVVGMLLIELIICELLVLIVHVPPAVPVVPVPLLPGDELDGQAVWPDVLNFTDRFCRGRHLK